MKNWQKIFTTTLAYQAEIVKGVLAENSIQSVVVDKKDTAYHIGEYEVFVAREQVMAATQIIKNDVRFQ